MSIQLYRNFSSVDLSFNKLTGTLIDLYQPPSTFINTSVNRLSGNIPTIFRTTNITLNVINGNLFQCPILEHDIALTTTSDISCGSSNLNDAFIAWLVLFSISSALLIGYLWYGGMKDILRLWWNTSYHHISSAKQTSSTSDSLLHTIRTISSIEYICSTSIVLTVFYIIVVMMIYIALKLGNSHFHYSVYQVQYLYTSTAAYLTGVGPSIAIYIFVTLSGLTTVLLCIVSNYSSVNEQKKSLHIKRIESRDEGVIVFKDRCQNYFIQIVLTCLLSAAALGINYGFVRIIYFKKPQNLSAVQFSFALIKFILGSIIVPYASSRLSKSSRAVYTLTMTVVVNIIAPGIAVLLASPLCLYYSISKANITDIYTITQGSFNQFGDYTEYLIPVTTSFTPEWNYSYQCSSSFLSSYLPPFVYLYILNGITSPAIKFVVMMIYSVKCNSYVEKIKKLIKPILSNSSVKDLVRTDQICDDYDATTTTAMEMSVVPSRITTPGVSDNMKDHDDSISDETRSVSKSNSIEYSTDVSHLMTSVCVDIMFMLTFGLASPLLALIISLSIVVNAIMLRLVIGRYMSIVSMRIGFPACSQQLEAAFSDAWDCLSDSWLFMSVFVGLFWSIFIFDMIGDSSSLNGGIIGAVLIFIWCPFVFVSAQTLLLVTNTDTSSYRYHFRNYIMSIRLSIHKFIWRCILPSSKVNEMTDNTTDADRISIYETAVSPLALSSKFNTTDNNRK